MTATLLIRASLCATEILTQTRAAYWVVEPATKAYLIDETIKAYKELSVLMEELTALHEADKAEKVAS
jgi:hypothetical protein